MTIDSRSRLAENLNSVREAIQSACSRSGRVSQEVTLVAVTKYAQFEWVQDLVELGVTDLGEARPQQLVLRADSFREDVRWHLIGHLQRNKAEDVLRVNCLIHSVDSLRLLSHLDQLGAKRGRVPNVLLEINVSGEASKDGFDPEELIAAWPEVCRNQTIEIAGLMTMAPLHEDSERRF